MPQFFIDQEFSAGDDVEIRGADARHIASVLRLGAGDWIVLSDGLGRSFRATITSATARSVGARIESELVRKNTLPAPALALAVIKGDRFEWAIQKAIEVGCRHLIPFCSLRTVPQYAESAESRKGDRWMRIALAAAKQSGLPFRPEVEDLREFRQVIGMAASYRRSVLLYEGERTHSLRSLLAEPPPTPGATQNAGDLLIVGPEGGFADDEVARATKAGITTVSLGPQILRVETAAVVALAVWQYELGNLNPEA